MPPEVELAAQVKNGSLIPPTVMLGVVALRKGVYTVKYGCVVSYPLITNLSLRFCTTIPEIPVDLIGLLTFKIKV